MMATQVLFPLVVVDVALFSVDERGLRVLLVKRALEPEQGRWALPGGVLKPDVDTNLEAAARRVLRNKVSVDIPHLEEIRTFSGNERDARGWSIAVLFYALLPRDQVQTLIRDKVEALEWADAAKPGHRLAFDHIAQLATALQVLRDKVERHALPLHLMPEKFTLTALQRTCEAILGRALDKAVFRRRLKGSADLVETDEYARGLQRPALLYRARDGFTFIT
jgi:ADP-ribose pyrophosphatase YjhB (NUDIX family)